MAVAYHALTEAGRAIISNVEAMSNGWKNEISRGVAAGDIEVTNMKGIYVAGA